MIEEFKYDEIEEILNGTKGSDLLPKYSDEQRWRIIIENPMLSPSLQGYKKHLDKLLEEPITLIPASLYLNYRRTGNRNPHDGIMSGRRGQLMAFVVGECIERKGRFMDAIMDRIWAICEESSWVIPAHSRTTLPEYTDISWIDLVSAETGKILAEVLYILGDRLDEHDPMIKQRVLYEIERRCWKPYLERDDMWWLFRKNREKLNNWTAVCNCGVVGSAILALDDNAKLAKMIEKCLRSMNDFLLCFDKDGGCDEGPGYWGYGVSNYIWLSYLLEMRTSKISLLNTPEMRLIAMFPQRTTLSGNNVVNFSDSSPRVGFSPSLMFYLGQRLSVPEISAFAQYQYDINPRSASINNVRDLVWIPIWGPLGRYPVKWKPEKHIYYSQMQWMISRVNPDDENTLMLAAKGGNNGENHNQNDVGNFIVHYGGESLIIDLGAGTYTKDYFSSKRYEILVNSSWGHNVPLVNGLQQPPGSQYLAQVLGHVNSETEDIMELELSNAYPDEAKVRLLRRRMSLHRDGKNGWIEIDDRIRFDGNKGECMLPLYVSGEVIDEGSASLRIAGEKSVIRVQYQPSTIKPSVEKVELEDKRISGQIYRIIFNIPIYEGSGSLNLNITPVTI
jgi:hypothetical protein